MSEGETFGLPGNAQPGQVAVKCEGSRVIMAVRYDKTGIVHWVDLHPEAALSIGQQLAKDAYVALYGTEPPKNALKEAEIEKKRQKLITRLSILLRQLRERKRPDAYIAQIMIDRVFAEIL